MRLGVYAGITRGREAEVSVSGLPACYFRKRSLSDPVSGPFPFRAGEE